MLPDQASKAKNFTYIWRLYEGRRSTSECTVASKRRQCSPRHSITTQYHADQIVGTILLPHESMRSVRQNWPPSE
jgi:hypothetical protein